MNDKFLQHKMKLRGISEFITKRKDCSGLLNLSCIFLARDKGVPENSIIRFSRGGTAFPFHNFSKSVFIEDHNLYAVSLVLTASHCTTDEISSEDYFLITECGFTKHNTDFKLILLNSFTSEYPEALISSNSWEYCLPGDVSVLILLSHDPDFRPYCFPIGSFSTCVNSSIPVMVCGYPELNNESFQNMYPYPTSDLETTRSEVNKTFFDGASLICSEGEVNESVNLLEITCSTYNGMSGSPIISDNKLIGIFCGGYPLPGQRQAMLIAKQLYRKEFIEAYISLRQAIEFDRYYDDSPFMSLANNKMIILMNYFIYEQLNISKPPYLQQYSLLAQGITREADINMIIKKAIVIFSTSLVDFIISAALHFNFKEELKFNVGISIKHPLFDKIRKIIERAEQINEKSINEIIYTIRLTTNFR